MRCRSEKTKKECGARQRLLPLAVVFLLLLSACGYRSPYTAAPDGAQAPRSVAAGLWKNRTNELGLETTLYQELAGFFTQSPGLRLAAPGEAADYVLTGEIVRVSHPGIGYTENDLTLEANAELSVRYSLVKKTESPEAAGAPRLLTLSEPYALSRDAAGTRANRQRALAVICQDLAERIYVEALSAPEAPTPAVP